MYDPALTILILSEQIYHVALALVCTCAGVNVTIRDSEYIPW